MITYKDGKFKKDGKFTKAADLTINARVRAMIDSGLTRSEVAKCLGIRYQRVRNVHVSAVSKLAGKSLVAVGFWDQTE